MHRVIGFFLPKEGRFFDLFCAQSKTLVRTSEEFLKFIREYETLPDSVRAQRIRRIRKLEQRGDSDSAQIIGLLNATLVTPYDREDIHALTVTLDDMVDLIDETARKLVLYKITNIPPAMQKQAEVMHELVKKTHETMTHFHKLTAVRRYCEDLYSLEHLGDELFENAISELFASNNTAATAKLLNVIKFKDAYESLESVFDKGKDVSDIVSAIVVKHG